MPFMSRELFKDDIDISGLWRKLANPPEASLTASVCCWTDLLGFAGEPLIPDWEPPDTWWQHVADRLLDAHYQCYTNLCPMLEFVLTLNDGIVRCCREPVFTHLDYLSIWLRSCIWTHNAINEGEAEKGLPGARTVLASGQNLRYSHVSARLDDFVLNYTKKDPTKLSSVAQTTGNPVVALNPGALQMNLAFSKAYVLESGGSAFGLSGPHMFADESMLSFIRKLSTDLGCRYGLIDTTQDSHRLFAVPKTQDQSRYHLGFELEEPPIEVDTARIRTTVWRVVYFYPWDEDVKDFKNPVN